MSEDASLPWWRGAVGYQIWPRSFADADGDGIGDLEGIRARLGHLRWLGVDLVWLSPFYPSPMDDFGYDVTDHTGVDPSFGSLAAFDRLLRDVHDAGMRMVADLIPNHTSDRHPWFVAARAGGRERDMYVWRPGRGDDPPNNWLSTFGGPAWTRDDRSGEWYLHSFLSSQPDLDWRNPRVRDAIADVMRFWLGRGVDGFRVDVVYRLMKDPALRDNPWRADATGRTWSDMVHVHDMDADDGPDAARFLREVLDAYPGRVGIGETTLRDPARIARYYADGSGLHLNFNFALCWSDWDAECIGDAIQSAESALPEGAEPCWALSNHDVPRHAARLGPDRAAAAAVLLLTLRGTVFLYQGEEIGMTGCDAPRLDPWGRDAQRTPMQWDGSPHAGFCPPAATPWCPVCADHVRVNVAAQRDDAGSLLHLYRRLVALRRSSGALRFGDWRRADAPPGVLAYDRSHGGETVRVLVSFTDEPVELPGRVRVLLRTDAAGPVLAPGAAAILTSGRYGYSARAWIGA